MSDPENGGAGSSKQNCTFTFKRRNRGRGGASLQVRNSTIFKSRLSLYGLSVRPTDSSYR